MLRVTAKLLFEVTEKDEIVWAPGKERTLKNSDLYVRKAEQRCKQEHSGEVTGEAKPAQLVLEKTEEGRL